MQSDYFDSFDYIDYAQHYLVLRSYSYLVCTQLRMREQK
jgi:hypothetical protein